MTPTIVVKAGSFDARASTERADARNDGASRPALTLENVIADHEQRVRRLARRLTGWSDADAEDVVQDVFVAVLEHLPRFRGDSSVATWVTAITLNRCRALRRRRMLRVAFFGKARTALDRVAPAAGQALADAERHERVRRAVRELPANDREVIVLRHLEQMGLDDVAAVVGASRGAVEVRLHRARMKLKMLLGDLMDEA